MTKLQELKNRLEEIYMTMPNSFFELEQRDKSAFLISREIEKIENPQAYEENLQHWEGHEIRL